VTPLSRCSKTCANRRRPTDDRQAQRPRPSRRRPDETVDADDLDPSPDTEPDLPAGPIETEEDTSVRESLSDFGATLSTLVRSYAATMHTLVRDHALPWLGDQARNARSLPKRAKRRVILFAVGPSNTIGTRVGAIVMLVATAAALAGAGFLAVASGVDAGGDSSWFMEQLVGAATSVWSYALVLLLLFAVIRVTQRSRAATKAASRTGFSEQTCHRLASEAQTADGASTVVVSPADSVDTACDRILGLRDAVQRARHQLGIRTSSTTISSRPPRRAQRRPRKPTLWSTTVRTWTRANTPTSVVSNWRARSTVATCSGRSPSRPA